MDLRSCKKVSAGRSRLPEETVAFLEGVLGERHDYWLHEEKVSEQLYWSAMFLEDVEGFRAMGKGTTAAQSRAGALAEAAESLSAREIQDLPGYQCTHQDDIEDALPIEDLLAHVATATPPVLERIKANDAEKLVNLFTFDSDTLRGGTGEIRAWITVAAAMQRSATVLDYFPSHHAKCGLAFAYWPEEADAQAAAE